MDSTDREFQVTTQDKQMITGTSQITVLLLVDDNFTARSSLKTWLTYVLPRIKILEADSGESALELFDFVTPRLILMDVTLPGMNGIDTVRQIIAREPESKIVMFSIHDEPQYREDARKAGATAFFSKSGKLTQLHQVLKEILGPDKNLPDQLLEE